MYFSVYNSHFINFPLCQFPLVNIDKMGIDKVGIDEVGINLAPCNAAICCLLIAWSSNCCTAGIVAPSQRYLN